MMYPIDVLEKKRQEIKNELKTRRLTQMEKKKLEKRLVELNHGLMILFKHRKMSVNRSKA